MLLGQDASIWPIYWQRVSFCPNSVSVAHISGHYSTQPYFALLLAESVTCIEHFEQNWKMLLMLEGWVRRMAGARQGVTDQRVRRYLRDASCWLGNICSAHLSGVQQIRGAAQPSGAELRMQLSATATISKISGLTLEAAFLWHLKNSLCAFLEAAAVTAHLELHLVSLFVACILDQPGIECRIFPFSSFDGPPRRSVMAHTVLYLQSSMGLWMSQAIPAVSLAEHAIVLLTSGPMWSMLEAAMGFSLHPFCRLPCYSAFGSDVIHSPTTEVLQALLTTTDLVLYGLGFPLDLPSPGSGPHSGATDPDAGHPASSAGPGTDSAAFEELQPASAEQRAMVLACITAANALLHSDALDRLIELWHVRVLSDQLGIELSVRGTASGSWDKHSAGSGSGESAGSCCGDAGYGLATVGVPLRALLLSLVDVLQRSHAFICLASTAGGDGDLSASSADFEHKLSSISFDGLAVSNNSSTSFFDVPTRTQAEATQAGLSMLSQLRGLAAELLTMSSVELAQPDLQLDSSVVFEREYAGTSWSRWEVLQAAMFRCLPREQQEDWGRPLVCCNPGCTNLEGPSELQLKTFACGGGCGVRYCSRECQVQGWRLGHRHSCGEIPRGKEKRPA